MEKTARVFVSDSHEGCVAKAAALFGIEADLVKSEVLKDGETTLRWMILAWPEWETAKVTDMNGYYILSYTDEGVVLELIPPKGKGEGVWRDEAVAYIGRKRLTGLRSDVVIGVFNEGFGYAVIAPPQEEYICGEEAIFTVSKNEMEAYAEILPPDPGGEEFTVASFSAVAAENGIVFGLDSAGIESLLAAKYGDRFRIAKGRPPEDGENGRVDFHFRTEVTLAPSIDEDDKADYRNLDLFESVSGGQVLVTRTEPTEGVPGSTVKGKELKAKPGRPAKMPGGKNVVFDDERLVMRAAMSGRVDYVGGQVIISNVFNVAGNAGMATGDIIFDGNIVVRGNVESGATIRATGTIEVYGVVEAATIEAGGNVILHRGIQGNDRGTITSSGDVTTRYIERARVSAKGRVIADSIMHSFVESDDAVVAEGSRGLIVGGVVRAGHMISARSIGASFGNKTAVEVGLSPAVRDRLQFLEKEVVNIKEGMEKNEKVLAYLEASELSEERQKLYESVVATRDHGAESFRQYSAEIIRIRAAMNEAVSGKVHVLETVYPGTTVVISSGSYQVTREMVFTTFKYSGGEIIFVPFEG